MAFPPNFTNVWDVTFPADTQLANLLGQDLRNFRTDIMQRLSLLSGTLINRPTPEIVNATWGGAGFGLLYFSTDTSQIFQWNGAAWTDITALFIKTSAVVSVDLTVQGANIAPTALLTPVANGFYRISAFIVETRAATTSSTLPVVNLVFTDADSSTAQTIMIFNGDTANLVGETDQPPLIQTHSGSPVFGFFAKGGVAIQYSTTGYTSVGATSMQYALHLRLEGPF